MGKIDRKTRLEILRMYKQGVSIRRIMNTLNTNGHTVSRDNVNYWIKSYRNGTFDDCLIEKVRISKVVSQTDVDIIVNALESDNCLSSRDIHRKLTDDGAKFSLTTTQRTINAVGYTTAKPRYGQMVRDTNKVKRVDFCQTLIANDEKFDDVIFSDETTVQLHNNKSTSYHKIGKQSKCIPKPKHPLKLHVWGAISRRGASIVAIFQDIMASDFFTFNILQDTLLPFIRQKFRHTHRLQMDNDPKHTSRLAKNFMIENGINWTPWPAGKHVVKM